MIGLGSNLGDRRGRLQGALRLLGERGCRVVRVSALRETEAWGFESRNRFLNGAAMIETELEPVGLLDVLEETERALGREHKSTGGRYEDRAVDLDILLYDDLVMNTRRLTIPHPRMCERRFVLEPLCEIAPQWVHPVAQASVAELLARLASEE